MIVPFPLDPRRPVEVFGKEARVFRQRGFIVDVICTDAFGRPFNTSVRLERVKLHKEAPDISEIRRLGEIAESCLPCDSEPKGAA